MKTTHWYKVLVLGGTALSLGCLGNNAPTAPDAATVADASGDATPAVDAAQDAPPDGGAPGCRVPCSGGICWG